MATTKQHKNNKRNSNKQSVTMANSQRGRICLSAKSVFAPFTFSLLVTVYFSFPFSPFHLQLVLQLQLQLHLQLVNLPIFHNSKSARRMIYTNRKINEPSERSQNNYGNVEKIARIKQLMAATVTAARLAYTQYTR